MDQDDLPVVLQWLDPRRPAGADAADVLISAPGEAKAATTAAAGRPVFVTAIPDDLPVVLAGTADGVVLDGKPAELLSAVTALPPAARGPLRHRWGLPAPRVVLHGARPFAPSAGKW